MLNGRHSKVFRVNVSVNPPFRMKPTCAFWCECLGIKTPGEWWISLSLNPSTSRLFRVVPWNLRVEAMLGNITTQWRPGVAFQKLWSTNIRTILSGRLTLSREAGAAV
jgi:hypothetical protein